MTKREKTTHIIYSCLVLILAVSLVVLAVMLRAKEPSLADFGEYYKVKTDSFITQNSNLANGQIVFIGDSITDLYILDNHYSDLNLATYNRGIGGDTTSGVLARLKISLFDIKPSKIVLMIGTNDVNGNLPVSKIVSNYEKILKEIKTNLPQAQLFCISVIPQNKMLETYTSIDVNKTTQIILQLNAEIKTLTESYNATYLDLFSLVKDENNLLKTIYSDDGIHLNEAGFVVWTNMLKPYLQ